VTRIEFVALSSIPNLHLTKPREKVVFPAPRSPSRNSTSGGSEKADIRAPISSQISGSGMDKHSEYGSPMRSEDKPDGEVDENSLKPLAVCRGRFRNP
jgi:hypothetical protein